jgi:hypothetical protein
MSDEIKDMVITSDTTADDIIEFMEYRLQNPVQVSDTTVFNLSSFDVQKEDLRDAIRLKLDKEMYVIPHQVTSCWGFMMTVLPDRIREMDVLVYTPENGEYRAYNSFSAQHEDEGETQENFDELVEAQLYYE